MPYSEEVRNVNHRKQDNLDCIFINKSSQKNGSAEIETESNAGDELVQKRVCVLRSLCFLKVGTKNTDNADNTDNTDNRDIINKGSFRRVVRRKLPLFIKMQSKFSCLR